MAEHGLSVSRATAAVKLSRSAYYRKPQVNEELRQQRDQPVIDALVARAQHGIFGYGAPDASYYEAVINWMRRRASREPLHLP